MEFVAMWKWDSIGFRARLSWVLATESPTRRRNPFASDRTCILEPGLPRSTGLEPARSPPPSAITWAESRTAPRHQARPGPHPGGYWTTRPGRRSLAHDLRLPVGAALEQVGQLEARDALV